MGEYILEKQWGVGGQRESTFYRIGGKNFKSEAVKGKKLKGDYTFM